MLCVVPVVVKTIHHVRIHDLSGVCILEDGKLYGEYVAPVRKGDLACFCDMLVQNIVIAQFRVVAYRHVHDAEVRKIQRWYGMRALIHDMWIECCKSFDSTEIEPSVKALV